MKKQKLYRSIHLHELFLPLESNESMMVDAAEKIADTGYYHGMEIGPFSEKKSLLRLKKIHENYNMPLMMWGAPLIWREQLSLSTFDKTLREHSIKRCLDMVNNSSEIQATYLGLYPGDDPGAEKREEAKNILAESLSLIAKEAAKKNVAIIIEPLDRYAHKKQLIGPMKESIEWFTPIHEAHPNTYIHWDSAHEALGEINLIESLNLASPFLAQVHLANCITDKNNPMYGDWHMDVGQPPNFETEGILTLETGVSLLKEIASFETAKGVPFTHVSVEMRSHLGDDLWHKEKTSRLYLEKCFELAGLE